MPIDVEPPNILFILFDKCRRDALGAYGRRDVHTPRIDELARSGALFTTCYTPQSLCGPARASILTGRHPHVHGLCRNVYPHTEWAGHPNVFPEAIPDPFSDGRFRLWDNVAFFLHNAGYRTAHIGKWHLGMGNPGFFDVWRSFNSGLPHWVGTPHASAWRPDVHTDHGIEFIAQNRDRPFFLYQSYYPPHDPLDPPRRFLEPFAGREVGGDPTPPAYDATISSLDENVGRLLDTLETHGLRERTLVVLASDHGRPWDTSRPGTGAGGQLSIPYDEVARVPLVMSWPQRIPAGTTHRAGVSLVDLMPTLLDAAGVHGRAPKSATSQRFDGSVDPAERSLLPDLQAGRDTWRRPVVLQNIAMTALDGSLFQDRALRTERHKLIVRRFDTGNHPPHRLCELFDMSADPGETVNLATAPEHRGTVRDLAGQLLAWGEEEADALAVERGARTLAAAERGS